ncbi:hypothetical protein J6TS7_18060 [Paenibacillus dendritiformis]|nr:hypothetical protein J6TS7_18060 [Paenibacillus dendritiformis]
MLTAPTADQIIKGSGVRRGGHEAVSPFCSCRAIARNPIEYFYITYYNMWQDRGMETDSNLVHNEVAIISRMVKISVMTAVASRM